MEPSRLASLCKKGFQNPQRIPPYVWRELKEFRHLQDATNIYEKDWDLLVLLDCARPDMMREVKKNFEFIDTIGDITSVGTCSRQWMDNTFVQKYSEQTESTIHITSNTSSENYLSNVDFKYLEEVWRDGWDEELGTIPAEKVTDRAIHYIRRMDAERYIVHYMQPHLPFVTCPDINSNDVTTAGIRGEGEYLGGLHKNEGYSRDELWRATRENLKYVLDSVEVLLSNINAERTIISADHGEAFGEQNIWNHPCRTYIDSLTQVPWCHTSAADSGNYNPEYEPEITQKDNISLENKLEALGYK